MQLLMNMTAQVRLGNVLLPGVQSFQIDENVLEIANTAKVVIPRHWKNQKEGSILNHLHVGDRVEIRAGYDDQVALEFTGYIREISSGTPLEIFIDDESYPLKQSNHVKSYRSAWLKEILTDVLQGYDIQLDCPDVYIGKYLINNASSYAVLQDLMKTYGLYSRLVNGVLRVGLAYGFGNSAVRHVYVLSGPPENPYAVNVKNNDLRFKRKDDFRVRYKAVATSPNGKRTTVIVGDKSQDAVERTLNFAGPLTEEVLRERANAVMAKVKYDGYTGDVTGFGLPRTHAGDAITIRDYLHPEREGTYLVEKVSITYNDTTGFSRKNTLNCKIG